MSSDSATDEPVGLAHIAAHAPNSLPALKSWLVRCLRDGHYARLEQAGHSSAYRLPLVRVFIDLETDQGSRQGGARQKPEDALDDPGQVPELPPGLLADLLDAEPVPEPVLQPHEAALSAPSERPLETSRDGRYLLIGGPGQGKSTLTQYLCQLHRVALLAPMRDGLDQKAREFLDDFADATVTSPRIPCIPAHIVLGELAAWMVRNNVRPERAVTAFLCHQIACAHNDAHNDAVAAGAATAGAEFDEAALEKLLTLLPWLLVFDGLDEVPESAGKGLVLAAIAAFRRRPNATETRTLQIATTRPQGHRGELIGEFEPRQLRALSRARAVAYSHRLVAYRYAEQPSQQRKILQRLWQAARDEATARLMGSPLQVTIMAALVERIGRPPHERWKLFGEYYRIIYERELERPHGPAGELLRNYRTHIVKLHQQVGLVLQAESERLGGTEALLSGDEFEHLIRQRLHEERFTTDRREALAREIRKVATERLVLLVSPRADRYGFELRSLQEFMAAEALMSGADQDVIARLHEIAQPVAWRNVLLFCAGHCFEEKHHLRGVITELCARLDALDGATDLALGGHLALDILADGCADYHPGQLAELIPRAVALLAQPPSAVQVQIAGLTHPDVRQALERALTGEWPALPERMGYWVALASLADEGVVWARSLANERWQAETAEGWAMVAATVIKASPRISTWLDERMWDSIPHCPPWTFVVPGGYLEHDPKTPLKRTLNHLRSVGSWHRSHNQTIPIVTEKQNSTVESGASSFRRSDEAVRSLAHVKQGAHPGWLPWVLSEELEREPSAEQLSDALEALASAFDREVFSFWAPKLWWPLGSCLAMAADAAFLRTLAARARRGELGDADDWVAAETRMTQGLSWDELTKLENYWPESDDIAVKGVYHPDLFELNLPELMSGLSISPLAIQSIPAINRCLSRMAATELRGKLAAEVVGIMMFSSRGASLFEEEVQHTWDHATGKHGAFTAVGYWPYVLGEVERKSSWLEILDKRLRSTNPNAIYAPVYPELVAWFVTGYRTQPTLHGLLRFLRVTGRSLMFDPRSGELGPVDEEVSELFGIPGELLRLHRFSEPDARDDAALLSLVENDFDLNELQGWLEEMATRNDENLVEDAHDFISGFVRDPETRTGLLKTLQAHLPGTYALLHARIRNTRRKDLGAQLSGIATSAAVWNQLALPAPSLGELRGANQPDALDKPASQPLGLRDTHIDRIELSDIRVFDQLTIDLGQQPTSDTRGRWLVLLGENGVGKSTVLRGLVLALAAPRIASALVVDTGARFIRRASDSSDTGTCTVTVHGTQYRAEFQRDNGHEQFSSAPETSIRRPQLFAYGCGRGSAIGGPKRDVRFLPKDSVHTLFDENADLIATEPWLKTRYLNKLKYPGSSHERLYDTIEKTLCNLLPGVESVDVDGDSVTWTGSAVGQGTALAELSDGYITTIGWVVDLMARWLEWAHERELPIDVNFPQTMEGLVLVDEIDLHLHPRWQRDLIRDLRTTFPRLSFVVTTHNPCTLLGAQPGEIFVLKRGQDKRVTVTQVDLPRGIRTDQVLTGEWFGLPSTLDDETLSLLSEHRELLRNNAADDHPRRKELEAVLGQRLRGYPAATTLEDMAQQVLSEVIDETYPEKTPAERLELRARYKESLARRRGRKTTD